MPEGKRRAGQLNAAGNWLVIDGESERQADGSWQHNCGAPIQSVPVYHSIHDGPFPLSGSGRVHVEHVPFCPDCEEAPTAYGMPISQ